MPSKAFGRGAPADDGPMVAREDHEKPQHLVRIHERNGYFDMWVNCLTCFARPNGWTTRGEPKYTGGLVYVSDRSLPRHSDKDGNPLRNAIAPCTCETGTRKAESARARWRAAGCPANWKLVQCDAYPPERRWRKCDEAGVEVISRKDLA